MTEARSARSNRARTSRAPDTVRERAFTARLAGLFTPPPGREVIGIGDDAALVRNHGSHTVAACDPVVEGVHFNAGAPLRLVGRKAVNRNLADLAAMGAAFDYALVSVLWPRGRSARGLAQLLRGVRDAVEGRGGHVVGGDTGSTEGPLTVTVTVLGHPVGRVLRRDGARAGDAIHVSAPLGGAILGHHLRFVPPLVAGMRLARRRDVTAAIDVSDGFVLDLSTLLVASSRASGRHLGARVLAAAVPVSRAARLLAKRSGRPPLAHALGDGEDHALLFTTRGPAPGQRPRRRDRVVGTVVEMAARRDAGAVFVVARDGTVQRVVGGYEHVLGVGP